MYENFISMMLEECPLISNFSPLVNETTRMRFPLIEHKIFKLMGSINFYIFFNLKFIAKNILVITYRRV